MNLSQLQVLVAIVDTGSLTEAAEVVSLTQSAVSYSLSKLEAELGVTLLERGRSGITVTRIGEEVVQHARIVISQTEIIRQKTARERGISVGKIRFGSVARIPSRLLTGIIRNFQHQYPDIEIIFFEGTPNELTDWLEQGIIDVGTVIEPQRFTQAAPLMHDEIKAITSVNHELAKQDSVPIERFLHEPLVGPKAEFGLIHQFIKTPQFSHVQLRYEVTTQNTIFAMVRENMGVTLMPQMLVEDIDGLKTLSFIPQLTISVYLAANTEQPATQAFLKSASQWSKAHGFLIDNP